jgi:ribosome recycling factor
MEKEIINKIKPELEKVINFLERELQKIRTSRVSVSLIENILVECFDQKFSLKQLAAISLTGPREILIQPWDKSYFKAIQDAILKSSLGVLPILEKESIRISFPPLSEEYRKNLLRVLAEKKEAAKRTIRHFREKAWKEIQEKSKKGEISEDEKFRAKDELQDLIDEYNQKIEEMGERKKKEIME